jgi:hypothetical protein
MHFRDPLYTDLPGPAEHPRSRTPSPPKADDGAPDERRSRFGDVKRPAADDSQAVTAAATAATTSPPKRTKVGAVSYDTSNASLMNQLVETRVSCEALEKEIKKQRQAMTTLAAQNELEIRGVVVLGQNVIANKDATIVQLKSSIAKIVRETTEEKQTAETEAARDMAAKNSLIEGFEALSRCCALLSKDPFDAVGVSGKLLDDARSDPDTMKALIRDAKNVAAWKDMFKAITAARAADLANAEPVPVVKCEAHKEVGCARCFKSNRVVNIANPKPAPKKMPPTKMPTTKQAANPASKPAAKETAMAAKKKKQIKTKAPEVEEIVIDADSDDDVVFM